MCIGKLQTVVRRFFDEPGSKLRIKDCFLHHGNGKDHFICAMGAPFLKHIIMVILGNVVETSHIGQVGKCHFHERQLLVHDFFLKITPLIYHKRGKKASRKAGKGKKSKKNSKKWFDNEKNACYDYNGFQRMLEMFSYNNFKVSH